MHTMEISFFKKSIIVFASVLLPTEAFAIIPPDFLVQIGYSIGIVFSFFSITLSIVALFFEKLKKNYINILIIIALICLISIAFYFFNKNLWKNKNYKYLSQMNEQTLELKPNSFLFNYIYPEKFYKESVSDSDIYILDVREDIEFIAGSLINSTHVRYADLLHSDLSMLPKNEKIYVLCLTGLRGELISDFLITNGFEAAYIKGGGESLLKYPSLWNGNTYVSEIEENTKLKKLISTDFFNKSLGKNTTVIDSRVTFKGKIEDSLSLNMLSSTKNELDEAFKLIEKNIIIVCNDQLSCFDSSILAIELEKKDYNFLGISFVS